MTGFYEVTEGDDPLWPEWCFTTPSGMQVTVTAAAEGSEPDAKNLAARLARYARSLDKTDSMQ